MLGIELAFEPVLISIRDTPFCSRVDVSWRRRISLNEQGTLNWLFYKSNNKIKKEEEEELQKKWRKQNTRADWNAIYLRKYLRTVRFVQRRHHGCEMHISSVVTNLQRSNHFSKKLWSNYFQSQDNSTVVMRRPRLVVYTGKARKGNNWRTINRMTARQGHSGLLPWRWIALQIRQHRRTWN